MIRCRVKPVTEYKNETVFINPKCGHVQKFEYCSPVRCQDLECNVEVPDIDKLFGSKHQGDRVKFYAEGKV
jgi:hypothetical protein